VTWKPAWFAGQGAEAYLWFLIKECTMAENQPKKAGEYQRPLSTSGSSAVIIGIVAAVILLILALLFFR